MPDTLSLRETAEALGIDPQILSQFFYRNLLDRERCPMFGRTRAIPKAYVPQIAAVLRRYGKLPSASIATGVK